MVDWYDFYLKRMNDKYREYLGKKYEPFLNKIVDLANEIYSGNKLNVAEFGCGAGNISRLLQARVGRAYHHLFDNSNKMLELASQNVVSSMSYIKNHDIIHPYKGTLKFDIIHSHGVLEHFSDGTIRDIISHQKEICNNLIHYVPSAKYKKPTGGDERLMTKEQWQEICNPDEIIEFNDDHDLILIWR